MVLKCLALQYIFLKPPEITGLEIVYVDGLYSKKTHFQLFIGKEAKASFIYLGLFVQYVLGTFTTIVTISGSMASIKSHWLMSCSKMGRGIILVVPSSGI